MKAALLYLSCVFALLHAPAQAQEAPAQQFAEYARCELVSGEAIESCRIGYRTVGTLNAARDNAILVPSWFTGTSEELVDYARSDVLDPSRYFLVLVDALTNGVSSSPSNHPTGPNEAFPRIPIGDMVESQHRLLTETLGIEQVHAIVGLSMGECRLSSIANSQGSSATRRIVGVLVFLRTGWLAKKIRKSSEIGWLFSHFSV